MDRRHALLTTGSVALCGFAGSAFAQRAPVEGKDFQRVAQPAPVSAPEGKVEVVEFFGYWCPHCSEFEPQLDAWVHQLPAWVSFRRVPVLFNSSQETTQRLYFALETLGLVPTLHRKVFAAYHVERKRFNTEADVTAWATSVGADAAKIIETMKSFPVANRLRQARTLTEGYRIDGVPTLGIHGRYLTSPSIAGTPDRALATADALIAQLRKG